jgi:CheY-like chemotaxis protein
MDGLEATRQIRQLTDTLKASIPIVALTANALKGDKERFLAAGMNDYLPKPINEPHLHRIITDNLTNQRNMITTDQDQRQNILPPKTNDADKLYNLSLVYSIAGGDEGFVKRMLQLFLDTMPLTLQEMQKEAALQSWAQVGKLAHKLKSTIDSMGISSLKETIRQIEQSGKKGEHTEQMPAQVDLVESIMLSCAAQVKKDFSL